MTSLFTLLLLLASTTHTTLDQVRAESNPDRRAHAAIDYAAYAERKAETAYEKGDLIQAENELRNVEAGVNAATEAYAAAHKTPGRNPAPFKFAEQRSREILNRLNDFERRMDTSERSTISGVRSKVQEVHDAWFEGLMGGKK